MSLLAQVGWRRGGIGLVVVALLAWGAIEVQSEKEIALVIGEPYESMRQRSSAAIGPAIPGQVSFNIPKSDARLRFTDPQYGFVTPLARFFTVIYRNELIYSVRMSPQIEPLLLDDTLKIVLDLQEQWRKGGWIPIRVKDDPPFADTPQWRAQLRDVNKGGTSYWQAGNQYQAMLVVNRFRDDKRPTEERYLITLALATPWVKP
ncbi:hypothetical protein [Pseudomonas fluorescens]|uniref:Uncharacterized protein n=1 Tax=Pseudomonas fluorescens TaxID=294 RepID=A0A5E7FL88_PSEFL|nr:hypothetical protein [Pseudomonas fluorescens]VVO40006.1 hypothetical protein PS691_05649 [Pseudomonas fluorescens]